MATQPCEFLDCGYCYDRSNDNNSSSDGSCSSPEKCEVLKSSKLVYKSKNKSGIHYSSGVMDVYSK